MQKRNTSKLTGRLLWVLAGAIPLVLATVWVGAERNSEDARRATGVQRPARAPRAASHTHIPAPRASSPESRVTHVSNDTGTSRTAAAPSPIRDAAHELDVTESARQLVNQRVQELLGQAARAKARGELAQVRELEARAQRIVEGEAALLQATRQFERLTEP